MLTSKSKMTVLNHFFLSLKFPEGFASSSSKDEVSLTNLYFPGFFFLPFLKIRATGREKKTQHQKKNQQHKKSKQNQNTPLDLSSF